MAHQKDEASSACLRSIANMIGDVSWYVSNGRSGCRSGILIPARQNCVWHSPPSCAIKRGKHRNQNPFEREKKISKERHNQHMVLIGNRGENSFDWCNQIAFASVVYV